MGTGNGRREEHGGEGGWSTAQKCAAAVVQQPSDGLVTDQDARKPGVTQLSISLIEDQRLDLRKEKGG